MFVKDNIQDRGQIKLGSVFKKIKPGKETDYRIIIQLSSGQFALFNPVTCYVTSCDYKSIEQMYDSIIKETYEFVTNDVELILK